MIFLITQNATASYLVVTKVIGKASGYKMNLENTQECSPPYYV